MSAKTITLSDGRTITLHSPRAVDLPRLTRIGSALGGMAEGVTEEQNNEVIDTLASLAELSAEEIGQLDLTDYMTLIGALTDVINVNPTKAPSTRKSASK